jgi:hypothetical protein
MNPAPNTDIEYFNDEYGARSLAFIADPEEWPRWPWLPMKHLPLSDPNSTGVVYASEDNVKGTGPFVINAWDMLRPSIRQLARYDSAADAIADGWRVD